jgi:hypothetical protein
MKQQEEDKEKEKKKEETKKTIDSKSIENIYENGSK